MSRQTQGFTAMVLCGGFGSRLGPVVADRPKSLAEIDGEPFLSKLLDQLAAAGCRRVILCTGHLGDQIAREYGDDHEGIELVYSPEPEPRGTAGALIAALDHADDEAVLVLNGDSFVDIRLDEFVRWARARGHSAALVAAAVEDGGRYGGLVIADGGRVAVFEEKRAERGSARINGGIYWFERRLLQTFIRRSPSSLEREVLPDLVERGLFAYETDAAFLDIGTPDSYRAASAFFDGLAQRRRRERKGLLVIDRDGTLIEERNYLADPAGVSLLPGVADGLAVLVDEGYELAIVTNQSGIARGYFDAADAAAVNDEVLRQLAEFGIEVSAVYVCPHHPADGCECRKPGPAMFERAMSDLGYLPEHCIVVGDKKCDVDLGARLGARTVLVRTGYGVDTERDGMCAPDVIVDGLGHFAQLEVAR